MIVGVLTTYHTQYTCDRSTYVVVAPMDLEVYVPPLLASIPEMKV